MLSENTNLITKIKLKNAILSFKNIGVTCEKCGFLRFFMILHYAGVTNKKIISQNIKNISFLIMHQKSNM